MATSSTSQWHTINPSTRPLALTILELTPLALTLSLSLAVPTSSTHQTLQSHHAHSHNHVHGPQAKSKRKVRHRRGIEGDSDDDTAVEVDEEHSSLPGTYPLTSFGEGSSFKDLLSHGVVVSVNGQPWTRIVAHVSDPEEDDGEEEEDDWEDAEMEEVIERGGIEEGLPTGITRRRPRRARFSLSAGNAVRDKEATSKRKGDKGRDKDRAVVVVYGLSPGKEYEIEIRVVGSGQEGLDSLVSNSVLIPPSPSPGGLHPRSRANSLRSRSRPRSRSNSLTHATAQDSANTTPPDATLAPTNILSPVDTQAAQMRHKIAATHADKDHLQTQIKEARRSSQRAEAALRVEIEAVKKAIEKAGSLDMRAKQKTLALQEQVKQAWAGAEHAEKEAADLEGAMASVEDRLEAVRLEVESAKAEYRGVKDREEGIRDNERKMRAEEEKRLADVVGKVEKLMLKKEKKEAEKADLEKRLEDLERQREDAERRNEMEKERRRQGAWWGPYDHEHRSMSAHPSLNNMAGQYAAGPAYRPRGAPGYQPRYPSAGAVRPQGSPIHQTGFTHQPVTYAPSLRPPASSPGNTTRQSSSGVNAAALPFHPSSQSFEHHTTLMPPQLQHRIYLPNVRPRPAPNFHPPPSVLAEQRASPTILSPPAFPPLPGTAPTKGAAAAPGPSLASIVTRAVLSPTSTLAGMNNNTFVAAPVRPVSMARSPPQAIPIPSPSPARSIQSPTPPATATQPSNTPSRIAAPQKSRDDQNFPPLSPTGPWSGFGGPAATSLLNAGMVRTGTPPWGHAPDSRVPATRSGSGSGGGSSGTPSRKNTGESG